MKYLKIFEGFDNDLCREIYEDETNMWKERVIGRPSPEAVEIIIEQIDKIESIFSKRVDDSAIHIGQKQFIYSRKPLESQYGPMDPDLHVWVSLCDDEWYIVDVYHNWYYYNFLCDDLIGLKELGSIVIDTIESNG